VSLWELVNAYRTLANGGVGSPLRMMPTGEGSRLRRRLYTREAAFLVSHILADRESRSATFGLESPLATRFWTAVKTGTSKDMRDNWCVGFSRRYTVGVWVGNFSGEPMRDVSGVTGAAPVWLEVMAWLHRAEPSVPPSPPAGVLGRRVAFSGGIEPPRREWFLRGTAPSLSAWSPVGHPAMATTQALLVGRRPHILQPASGVIIALDPDIPPARQRVVFEAAGTGGDAGSGDTAADAVLRWRLDGADLGPAGEPLRWAPRPGRHTLSLADEEGRTLDEVAFEVRGASEAWRD
jgi:penicillin-binding protein 1C